MKEVRVFWLLGEILGSKPPCFASVRRDRGLNGAGTGTEYGFSSLTTCKKDSDDKTAFRRNWREGTCVGGEGVGGLSMRTWREAWVTKWGMDEVLCHRQQESESKRSGVAGLRLRVLGRRTRFSSASVFLPQSL